MTDLTLKARAATFCLDQLLAAKRRGHKVCVICGDLSAPAHALTCPECGATLFDPRDVIVMNMGPNR